MPAVPASVSLLSDDEVAAIAKIGAEKKGAVEKEGLTEGSIIGRIVAIITPFLAAAAAWLVGYVARHTGVKLDQTEIVALMVSVVTAGLGVGWKWLEGLQKHEQRVAEGKAVPIREARTPKPERPEWKLKA
jgi:hypothetical protein